MRIDGAMVAVGWIAIAISAAGTAAVAATAGQPIPKDALEHPPSEMLAAVPALAAIATAGDCELVDLRRAIDRQADAARARQEQAYDTDGAAPPPATPQRARVVARAAELTGDCLDALDLETTMRRTVTPEIDALLDALHPLQEEFRTALSNCPSDPEGGGKVKACVRSLYARFNVRGFAAVRKHLATADAEFAEGVRRATACLEKREALVREGMAAGVAGAEVNATLAPLTRAWAVPPLVAERYISICRTVREAIDNDIPKPR